MCNLKFVNVYRCGVLEGWPHDCLISSCEGLLLFTMLLRLLFVVMFDVCVVCSLGSSMTPNIVGYVFIGHKQCYAVYF